MEKVKKRSDCPISCSLDVLGDKWSLLIVRDLLEKQQSTYGDFLKAEEKIATNILATRLQMLEENGIISKLDHPESKAKVLYKLTKKGIDLLPIIVEFGFWADKYYTIDKGKKAALREIKKDKETFIKTTIQDLKKGLEKG
ncbi:MAG: helix-turn-helix transcriptional regulator [Saprospiraceae bacterium]|jgi:DNA-binding HxlR family transcriptional regulator|nr:helix-turn-helix transcriptional regulator [Saprospiraceae bacterium]